MCENYYLETLGNYCNSFFKLLKTMCVCFLFHYLSMNCKIHFFEIFKIKIKRLYFLLLKWSWTTCSTYEFFCLYENNSKHIL